MRFVRIGKRYINLDLVTDVGLNASGAEAWVYFGGVPDTENDGNVTWVEIKLVDQDEIKDLIEILESFRAHKDVADERYVFPSEEEH